MHGSTMKIESLFLQIDTGSGISVHNISAQIDAFVGGAGIRNGFVTVTSQHTTTAITINENEKRLIEDMKAFFARLIPAGDEYLHNDIHLRDCPPDEPQNAHSHLAAMLLGSSEVIPLQDGKMLLGQWQSVMLVELDGPRTRSIAVRVYGQ